MSIIREGQTVKVFYVGVQKRKNPLPGEKEAKGFVYNVTEDNIHIYGAPKITLQAGQRYKFVINTPKHPFYITSDPEGGKFRTSSMEGAIEIPIETSESKGNVGIENGVLVWTPSVFHSQMNLFYQCNYHKNMGGVISVIAPGDFDINGI